MRWIWGIVLLVIVIAVWLGASRVKFYGQLIFVSCPLNFTWQLNKDELAKIMAEIPSERVIVYLACELQKTQESAGSGESEPFVYAQRSNWLGISSLNIYLDVPVWWGYEEHERQKGTGMLVISQLAKQAGLNREQVRTIQGKAYYNEEGTVWLSE